MDCGTNGNAMFDQWGVELGNVLRERIIPMRSFGITAASSED
jgi:glucose-6-phosphate isomerase